MIKQEYILKTQVRDAVEQMGQFNHLNIFVLEQLNCIIIFSLRAILFNNLAAYSNNGIFNFEIRPTHKKVSQ